MNHRYGADRVSLDVLKNRISRLVHAMAVVVILVTVCAPAHAQDPDPRPAKLPFFYDPEGIYDEGQARTLARDAKLLQSSEIPMLVYVRVTNGEDATLETAQDFADSIRKDWSVESASGADDGLVLLYSHVPGDGAASTVVASWGAHTFDNSGLTPEYIQSVISGDVRALLDQGHSFEALVYGMREIRYAGIYFPPQPEPLTGVRATLHNALSWVAPITLGVTIIAMLAISLRHAQDKRMPAYRIWRLATIAGLVAVVIATLSVIGESTIGIVCALLIVAILAVQAWLWTHPSPRLSNAPRNVRVPSTSQRIRVRKQLRETPAIDGAHK